MEKQSKLSIMLKGFIKENPVFVLVLGTCPTLAVTDSVSRALSMGIAAAIVLICSNMAISALRKVIPDKVRIPAYIVIIAGFVTIIQMLMNAYLPDLYTALGKHRISKGGQVIYGYYQGASCNTYVERTC